jgi:hypothetical protein
MTIFGDMAWELQGHNWRKMELSLALRFGLLLESGRWAKRGVGSGRPSSSSSILSCSYIRYLLSSCGIASWNSNGDCSPC